MKFLKILFLAAGIQTFGQTTEDSVTFESSFAWLERKMTFNYYDPTNQHWWVNRIQANSDGTYTIKNIAAKHPDKVHEKVYHNRTLFLYDLNPNTISVINNTKDQGRFVKGKIIRAECFTGEKVIQVVKNGKSGSKVGFIHISVPEILEDSAGGYAQKLANKLKETTYLSARLFNTGNTEDNITAAFKSFRGKYVNEDSTAYIDFEVMDVGLVRFTFRKDNKTSYGTIGYDINHRAVYFFLAGNKTYSLDNFTFKDDHELILSSAGGTLHVIGRNNLQFDLKKIKGKFIRY